MTCLDDRTVVGDFEWCLSGICASIYVRGMYMRVCMCVCVYIYIYIHTYSYMNNLSPRLKKD